MRHSLEQHNVARLRAFLHKHALLNNETFDQQRFAKLIGCGLSTLQQIETGTKRFKLSEELAHRIHDETGVDVGWLLSNNLKAPIVNFVGAPYKFEDYERMQASKMPAEYMEVLSVDFAAAFYGEVRAMLSSAAKRGRAEIALYRIAKVLENCSREFGHDTEVVPRKGQFDKRSDNLKRWRVEAGITLFKKDCRQRDAIIRRTMQQLKQGKVRFVTDMGAVQMVMELDKKASARVRRTKKRRRHWEYRVIKGIRRAV
jgi:transcriptional regulator with XRE-family HTH domain